VKEQVGTIPATPSKRIFYSIIVDYTFDKAIAELIDNVLDIWTLGGKQKSVRIDIRADVQQQVIRIHDNAGGFPKRT
jgi:hypothetical protein